MSEQNSVQEIISIILNTNSESDIKRELDNYHDNDIADALKGLDTDSRKKLYRILDVERVAEVLAYTDNISDYMEEFSPRRIADILRESIHR